MSTKLKVINEGSDSDEHFMLIGARVNFPQLYRRGEPTEASPDGIGKGVTALLDTDGDADIIKKIQKIITKTLKIKNKGKKVASNKLCLRDGDDSGREEYEGLHTLRLGKADSQKLYVYRKGTTQLLSEQDNEIYSGCRCNIKFQIYFGVKGGKGVWGDLIAIQFAADDEPISGSAMSQENAIEGFDTDEQESEADGFGDDGDDDDDDTEVPDW